MKLTESKGRKKSLQYTGGWYVWVEWFLAGNQKFQPVIDSQVGLTNFHEDEAKKKNLKKESKMADSKKLSFSKSTFLNIFLWKFHELVLGLVGLIDAKGIDVA